MFTNKLNANGEEKKNVHTQKEKKKQQNTLYNICCRKKKKCIIESMNIALIVHFTPQTLREARGRGHVVLSSEMVGGKKEKKRATHPATGMGEEKEKKAVGGGERCVCVCVDIL